MKFGPKAARSTGVRSRGPAALILAAATLFPLAAGAAGQLTLDEAFRLAEEANPTLRAAQASVLGAEGEVRDSAGLLFNNPAAATELTQRRARVISGGGTDRWNEWNAGLSQAFEIAGQHGHRRDAAQASLAAANINVDAVRRQVRAEVERAFVAVLAMQARVDIERESLRIADDTAAAVRKRVDAGEDSRLEGNLAAIEAERAQNQLRLLQEQLAQARVELAKLLQLPPGELPEAAGDLDPGAPLYRLDSLLEAAAKRPQLRVLESREQAARSRLALERAAAYPDVTVGLFVGQDSPPEVRERLTTLALSVPIPLYRRNDAAIGRASTELAQIQVERQAAMRDARTQLTALYARLESVRARVARLRESVLPRLEENQRLSLAAFRAGELSLVELLLVNRQVLDGRRDLLDAGAEQRLTRVAIEEAAGWDRHPPRRQ